MTRPRDALPTVADRLEVEARATLAAIVESSADAIVSKTLEGTITSWNPAAEAMFGHAAAEVIGSSILVIVPPDRHQEEDGVLARVRKGEVLHHFETVRVRKDRSLIQVSVTVSPVKDGQGRIVGASKIARDITDRLRAEEERARLLHEAQESNRAKHVFLAMLGHELRNPLAAIMASLDLLEHVGGVDATAVRARDVGRRQGAHLAKLLDDLLDVGRVMTGKIMIHAEPLDLGAAVRTHVATMRTSGSFSAHQVTVETSEVSVRADAVRLEQIVMHLVGNALRYTPPGGNVRVCVERIAADAVLWVEDDGAGISPELLPHIFDLFVQSERRLDRSQGGLGIGLALVRRLAELQGGRIEARSEGRGRGSCFTLRLPALRQATSPAGASRPSSSARAEPCRILLVEDNDDAREMLAMLLRLEGHEVHEASNGQDGVETAVRLRPDVALLDIGLPKLDGYEAAREIRRQLGDAVRLVALTGYGSKADRQRAMSAGFDVHLRKPIEVGVLRTLLRDVATKRK